MNAHLPATAPSGAHPPTGEHGSDDVRAVRFLCRVSNDASDNAARIAELLRLDNDPNAAALFLDISAKHTDFARELSGSFTERGLSAGSESRGTVFGWLFRLRLRIAAHIPVGYRNADDRRFLLRLARRGSSLIARAYTDAELQLVGDQMRQAVVCQAQAVRVANHQVHVLAANA